MTTDIPFILDALRGSHTIEVQVRQHKSLGCWLCVLSVLHLILSGQVEFIFYWF